VIISILSIEYLYVCLQMAGGQSPLEVVFEDESTALSYSRIKQV